MTANSGPTTSQPETDDAARSYLRGFDDHADVIDQPVEHAPEDVVVLDRGQRRLTVFVATSGAFVIIRSPLRGRPRSDRVVTALDRDNARGLSDALQWAARIAEPRSLDLEPR